MSVLNPEQFGTYEGSSPKQGGEDNAASVAKAGIKAASTASLISKLAPMALDALAAL